MYRVTPILSKPSRDFAVFSDETYPDGTAQGRVISVSIGVPRKELEKRRPAIRALAQLRRKRQVPQVKAFLNDPAFLVSVVSIERSVVYGDQLLRRDEFSDTGSISRTDQLWGQSLGYSVGLLARVILRYWKLWPITVYYDARKLNRLLQQQVENGIKSIVPRLASEELRELGRPGELEIRDVVGVVKSRRGDSFTLEHDGVWLADATAQVVCVLPNDEFGPNFVFKDATSVAVTVARAIRDNTGPAR